MRNYTKFQNELEEVKYDTVPALCEKMAEVENAGEKDAAAISNHIMSCMRAKLMDMNGYEMRPDPDSDAFKLIWVKGEKRKSFMKTYRDVMSTFSEKRESQQTAVARVNGIARAYAQIEPGRMSRWKSLKKLWIFYLK